MLKASVLTCTILAAGVGFACGPSPKGNPAATTAEPSPTLPSGFPSGIPTALPSGAPTEWQKQFEKIRARLVKRITNVYEFAGATPTEAECIAEALLALDPGESRVYGTMEEKARKTAQLLREHASSCASQARLLELGRASVLAPYQEALVQAGARPKEITCFFEQVEELDLFLPSEDFNGKRAARTGTARILEEMDGCLPEKRVREIVKQVFANSVEGCARTSEDPLAPFEC